MTLILGIDPGRSGGIAWGTSREDVQAIKMPETAKDIWDAIAEAVLKEMQLPIAYLEKVGPAPRRDKDGAHSMGAKSAWNFSGNYHRLEMALIGNAIPFELVRPQEWKRTFSLTKRPGETPTQYKNRSKARAQELFPQLKVTHAIGEALLLWEFGRRRQRG